MLAKQCPEDAMDYAGILEYRRKNGLPLPSILLSACLAGERCRYDGGDNLEPALKALADSGQALAVCPERAGGLPCPRTPCERLGKRILGQDGGDYTGPFLAGAEKCLEAARVFPIRAAILKERSPSCGVNAIYDGGFSRRLIPGEGVFAGLLRREGIALYTEETWNENTIALEKLK